MKQNIPIVGNILMTEWWMPKTAHEKNIILGKVMVFCYVCLAFIMTKYEAYMLLLTAMPILYHVEFFKEHGR